MLSVCISLRPAVVAVVDMCNSWNQRLIGLCAQFWESAGNYGAAAVLLWARPTFAPPRAGPWCDHGLRSYVIVTATIGDVAIAAMQPTYLLAAICRGGLGGLDAPGPRETEMSCPNGADTRVPRLGALSEVRSAGVLQQNRGGLIMAGRVGPR